MEDTGKIREKLSALSDLIDNARNLYITLKNLEKPQTQDELLSEIAKKYTEKTFKEENIEIPSELKEYIYGSDTIGEYAFYDEEEIDQLYSTAKEREEKRRSKVNNQIKALDKKYTDDHTPPKAPILPTMFWASLVIILILTIFRIKTLWLEGIVLVVLLLSFAFSKQNGQSLGIKKNFEIYKKIRESKTPAYKEKEAKDHEEYQKQRDELSAVVTDEYTQSVYERIFPLIRELAQRLHEKYSSMLYQEYKERTPECLAKCEEYKNKVEELKNKFDINDKEIKSARVLSETITFPEKYDGDIKYIIGILDEGRASTYKEAINIYLEDKRKDREENARRDEAREQLEEMRRANQVAEAAQASFQESMLSEQRASRRLEEQRLDLEKQRAEENQRYNANMLNMQKEHNENMLKAQRENNRR